MHSRRSVRQKCQQFMKQTLAAFVVSQLLVGPPVQAQPHEHNGDRKTTSPIKHVIIIIGENRSCENSCFYIFLIGIIQYIIFKSLPKLLPLVKAPILSRAIYPMKRIFIGIICKNLPSCQKGYCI